METLVNIFLATGSILILSGLYMITVYMVNYSVVPLKPNHHK